MFCHFRSKMRVCGNHCHTLSFKDEDNLKMPVDAEKNKLQNCCLGFFKFWKFWKFWDFFQHFIFSKNPPKFQNFQKNGIYVLGETLKNLCTKFQAISFINAVFIALWMWKKWLLFMAFGRNTTHFHIFILFRFLCNKRCSKVIFRVLDEKSTHKHV